MADVVFRVWNHIGPINLIDLNTRQFRICLDHTFQIYTLILLDHLKFVIIIYDLAIRDFIVVLWLKRVEL